MTQRAPLPQQRSEGRFKDACFRCTFVVSAPRPVALPEGTGRRNRRTLRSHAPSPGPAKTQPLGLRSSRARRRWRSALRSPCHAGNMRCDRLLSSVHAPGSETTPPDAPLRPQRLPRAALSPAAANTRPLRSTHYCLPTADLMLVNTFLQKSQLHTALLYVFLQLQLVIVNFFLQRPVLKPSKGPKETLAAPGNGAHTMARALQDLAAARPHRGGGPTPERSRAWPGWGAAIRKCTY